ncbi:MAG: hypothetical protein WCP09_03435 [Candidatus Taylorbacteria bacterium]
MKKISIIGKNNPSIEGGALNTISFLEDMLKVELKHPVIVTLCSTRKEYEKKLGRKTLDWEVGNTNVNNIHILHPESFEKYSTHKKDEFQSILKHELAHIFIGQLSEGKTIPMWLDEGLANCLAGQMGKYFNSGSIYAETNFLEKLSTNYGWDQYSSYNGYGYSCLFVDYLIRKFSIDQVLELIGKSKKIFSIKFFESIFIEVFKSTLDDAEQNFIKELN